MSQREYWANEFYDLLSQRCLVEVRPIDDWSSWTFRITLEDCMAPMFIAYESSEEEPYKDYETAMKAGISKAKLLLL